MVKRIFSTVEVDLEGEDENGDTLMQLVRQRDELACDGHWYHRMKTYFSKKGAKKGNASWKMA